MQTYVILRRSAWDSEDELEAAAAVSRQVADEDMDNRVRWIRSYVLEEEDGTVGTVCIYQAEDEEAIIEHAQRAELPADEIIPVSGTVIVRDDP
jgi:thiamine biosynthesis protein ThiC